MLVSVELVPEHSTGGMADVTANKAVVQSVADFIEFTYVDFSCTSYELGFK